MTAAATLARRQYRGDQGSWVGPFAPSGCGATRTAQKSATASKNRGILERERARIKVAQGCSLQQAAALHGVEGAPGPHLPGRHVHASGAQCMRDGWAWRRCPRKAGQAGLLPLPVQRGSPRKGEAFKGGGTAGSRPARRGGAAVVHRHRSSRMCCSSQAKRHNALNTTLLRPSLCVLWQLCCAPPAPPSQLL